MRAPESSLNTPLFEYTLMPTHMMSLFHPRELQDWEKDDGYGFMKVRRPSALLALVFTRTTD
eukprot:COSAG04_NODE_950_length_9211_cov_69.923068_7_plen_62_part_00